MGSEREREQERALTEKMRKKNGLGSERERELYQIKMRKKMGSEKERERERASSGKWDNAGVGCWGNNKKMEDIDYFNKRNVKIDELTIL